MEKEDIKRLIKKYVFSGDTKKVLKIYNDVDVRDAEWVLEYTLETAVDYGVLNVLEDILTEFGHGFKDKVYRNLIHRALKNGDVEVLTVLDKHARLNEKYKIESDILEKLEDTLSNNSIKLDLDLARYLRSRGVRFTDKYVWWALVNRNTDVLRYLREIRANISEENREIIREFIRREEGARDEDVDYIAVLRQL